MHKFFIDFSDFLMRKNLNGEYHHLFRLVEKKPLRFMRLVKNLLASREIDFEQKIKPLLEIQDKHGQTPLHLLAWFAPSTDFTGLMTWLLTIPNIDFEQQIKPLLEKQDIYGYTPLHYFAFYKASKFIELITPLLASPNIDLEQKIKPLLEIQDSEGITPLHELAINKTLKFIELIMGLLKNREINFEQKIKPLLEIQDRDGNTPLHILASKNSSKFIELMKQLLAKTGIELQNYIPALQRNSNGEEFVIAVNEILSLYFQNGESALNSGERPLSEGTTFFSLEDNRTKPKKRQREESLTDEEGRDFKTSLS